MLWLAAPAQSLTEKGLNAERKGLDELAENYYRQAADTGLAARLRLGMLLERQERYAEAAQMLARADSGAEAMCHLALCLMETGDPPAARSAAERCLEQAPDGERALRSSAMATMALALCADGNFTNAAHWAGEAQKTDPSSARALNAAGIVQFRQGHDAEAIRLFRQATAKEPKNVDAYFNLGTMYCYRNNYESAIGTLRKGLQVERRSVKLLYCLGWAFMLKGDSEAAVECLESVTGIDSTHVNAYNRLGDIYFERGEHNRALAQYRHAAHFGPRLPEAWRLMGRTYVAMGENQKALRHYQKAVEADPQDAETYFQMALLYGKQKNNTRETANYRRAARLGHKAAQQWCTRKGLAWNK